MRRWRQRLFGGGEDKSAAASEALPRKTCDKLVDESSLFKSIVERGLAESIVRGLRASEGWPFDLGDGTVNEEERLLLNLWGFAAAVIRTRFSASPNGPSVASVDEKRAFLDQFYKFFWPILEERPPFSQLTPSGRTIALRKLSALTAKRYPEYDAALHEMMKESKEAPINKARPFVQAVTGSLFGRQTNNDEVMRRTGVDVLDHFLTFAASLGSEESWKSLQRIGHGT